MLPKKLRLATNVLESGPAQPFYIANLRSSMTAYGFSASIHLKSTNGLQKARHQQVAQLMLVKLNLSFNCRARTTCAKISWTKLAHCSRQTKVGYGDSV